MARTSAYLNCMGQTPEAFNVGGHVLMGMDALESTMGNDVSINLEPDTREEAERLFAALSEGGKVGMALQDMFRGAPVGSLTDRFGVQWMVNCSAPRP